MYLFAILTLGQFAYSLETPSVGTSDEVEYYLSELSELNYDLLSIDDVAFLYKAYEAGFGLPIPGSAYDFDKSATMMFLSPNLQSIPYDKIDKEKPHYMLRVIRSGATKTRNESLTYSQIVGAYQFYPNQKTYRLLTYVHICLFDQYINKKYFIEMKKLYDIQIERLKEWKHICNRYAKEKVSLKDMILWLSHTPDFCEPESSLGSPFNYNEIARKISYNDKPLHILVTISIRCLEDASDYNESLLMRYCLQYRYCNADKIYTLNNTHCELDDNIILLTIPLDEEYFR